MPICEGQQESSWPQSPQEPHSAFIWPPHRKIMVLVGGCSSSPQIGIYTSATSRPQSHWLKQEEPGKGDQQALVKTNIVQAH